MANLWKHCCDFGREEVFCFKYNFPLQIKTQMFVRFKLFYRISLCFLHLCDLRQQWILTQWSWQVVAYSEHLFKWQTQLKGKCEEIPCRQPVEVSQGEWWRIARRTKCSGWPGPWQPPTACRFRMMRKQKGRRIIMMLTIGQRPRYMAASHSMEAYEYFFLPKRITWLLLNSILRKRFQLEEWWTLQRYQFTFLLAHDRQPFLQALMVQPIYDFLF